MKLSIKGLALAAAILWGAAVLMVGIANMIFPDYGMKFLEVIGSVYPGYQAGAGIASVIIGAIYAVVDAGIAAAIFAWLYNLFTD